MTWGLVLGNNKEMGVDKKQPQQNLDAGTDGPSDIQRLRIAAKGLVTASNPGACALELREKQGLSREEVAERIGSTAESIRFFEETGLRPSFIEDLFSDREEDEAFEDYCDLLDPTDSERRILHLNLGERLQNLVGLLKQVFPDLAANEDPDPWAVERERKKPRPRTTIPPEVSARRVSEPISRSTENLSPSVSVDGRIRYRIELVVEGAECETRTELVEIRKHNAEIADIGLSLAEGKEILRRAQEEIVHVQARNFVAKQVPCSACGRQQGRKGRHSIAVRSLFGSVTVDSPRLYRCRCGGTRGSYSPLSSLFSERATPELIYMESKWATVMSYEMTKNIIRDLYRPGTWVTDLSGV